AVMRVGLATLLAATLASAAGAADPCATTAGSVTGHVTRAGGGAVAGARVRVQTCLGDPVLTDAAGAFTLPVPAGPRSIATPRAGGLGELGHRGRRRLLQRLREGRQEGLCRRRRGRGER